MKSNFLIVAIVVAALTFIVTAIRDSVPTKSDKDSRLLNAAISFNYLLDADVDAIGLIYEA